MNTTPQNFSELVGVFLDLISLVVPLIFAVTFLFIVWQVINTWIISGGDADKIKDGKQYVMIGVIALVVMSGIWGILTILRESFFGF